VINNEIVKPTLAVDGTLLLAADSFLRPSKKSVQDPEAKWAFQYLATAFCSDLNLFYPAPKEPTKTATPLFSLWIEYSSVRGGLGISSGEHEHVIKRLRRPFLNKVIDDAPRVAKWLAFQFQPEMVPHYLGGGNPVDELPDFIDALGDDARLPAHNPIVVELQRLQRDAGTPGVFRDLAYRKGLTDLQVALAYLYQAYAKGVSYAWGLGEEQSNPIYRPHWLRESAMLEEDLVDKRIHENIPLGCFPWGLVLSHIFDPSAPHERPAPDRAGKAFQAIRSFASKSENCWVFELDWPKDDPKEEARISKAIEGFILDGLAAAKLVPLYRHAVLDRIVPLAGDYAAKRIGQIAFDTVISPLLQPRIIRRAEMTLRRRYRLDTVWKAFLKPGIDDTVSAWHRQRA
jgi:hypothetical protein